MSLGELGGNTSPPQAMNKDIESELFTKNIDLTKQDIHFPVSYKAGVLSQSKPNTTRKTVKNRNSINRSAGTNISPMKQPKVVKSQAGGSKFGVYEEQNKFADINEEDEN